MSFVLEGEFIIQMRKSKAKQTVDGIHIILPNISKGAPLKNVRYVMKTNGPSFVG